MALALTCRLVVLQQLAGFGLKPVFIFSHPFTVSLVLPGECLQMSRQLGVDAFVDVGQEHVTLRLQHRVGRDLFQLPQKIAGLQGRLVQVGPYGGGRIRGFDVFGGVLLECLVDMPVVGTVGRHGDGPFGRRGFEVFHGLQKIHRPDTCAGGQIELRLQGGGDKDHRLALVPARLPHDAALHGQ